MQGMGTSNRTTPRPPRGGVRHFSVEPIALVLVDTWYETKKYDTDFYAGQAGPARASAAAMVPLILQAVGPVTSILDVGCGVGAWLAEWASAGIEDYLGVDGDYVDRANLLVSPEHFRAQDLKTPLDLGRRFDLVTSFEVAEHLPEAVADQFVAGLVRHADVVVFSAAIPGQGGVGHVNEQWQSYWARKFTDLGLETHDDLRWKVWEDDRIEFYYAQNTVIYRDRACCPVRRRTCSTWRTQATRSTIGCCPSSGRCGRPCPSASASRPDRRGASSASDGVTRTGCQPPPHRPPPSLCLVHGVDSPPLARQ